MKHLLAIMLFIYGFTPFVNCDINHDGHISTTDIVMHRQGKRCDANLDGVTDETDVNFMRYYLANRRN